MDSATVVDIVVVFFLVEIVALAVIARTLRSAPRFSTLLPTLLAGFFLALALRAAARDAGPMVIGVCVALSGLAHAWDLTTRWRSTSNGAR